MEFPTASLAAVAGDAEGEAGALRLAGQGICKLRTALAAVPLACCCTALVRNNTQPLGWASAAAVRTQLSMWCTGERL